MAVAVAISEATSLESWAVRAVRAVRAGEAGIVLRVQAVWLAPTYVPGFLDALMSFCPSWKPHFHP